MKERVKKVQRYGARNCAPLGHRAWHDPPQNALLRSLLNASALPAPCFTATTITTSFSSALALDPLATSATAAGFRSLHSFLTLHGPL